MASAPEARSEEGVQFAERDGRRSSQAAGKSVFADSVRAVDADLAGRIERSKNWRKEYFAGVCDIVAAGARSPKDSLRIAADGLDSIGSNLVFVRAGEDVPLRTAVSDGNNIFETATIEGAGTRVTELEVPYKGAVLKGDALLQQIDKWRDAGVLEQSCATALAGVVSNRDWLDLSDRTFALLGASSEMGPLEPLTSWGAEVIAVDLPRRHLWDHIAGVAKRSAGRVHAPSTTATFDAGAAGVDLLTDAPAARAWLGTFETPLTIGNYVYADGANFVRLAGAVDALIADLVTARPDTSLAYLATPTDAFAVPRDVVDGARSRAGSSIFKRALKTVSASNLYDPNYATLVTGEDGAEWGISDALVPIQGPNYALAKSLQRWRAMLAREDGTFMSANIAPSTRTRSVTKNRLLAAAYRGAPAFGVEIFEPETSRVLTAALLVHDLRNPASSAHPDTQLDHPYELFVRAALHGGIWRLPHTARSILPLGLALGVVRR